MNNQQREQQALNQQDNKELLILEEQLREAAAAEDFFNQASGKLWTKVAQEEINKVLNDITSDKYIKDHAGYVNALADLRAYRKILRKMQVAASPIRKAKIQEKIDGDGED